MPFGKRTLLPWWVAATALVATVHGSAWAATNAPYYAAPSWDQKLRCDTPNGCKRFLVLGNWNNEAVLDKETGLIWQRSPSTQPLPAARDTNVIPPTDASFFCMSLIAGGRKGWRLPTYQELESLVDPTRTGPALPPGHPFSGVQVDPDPFAKGYWTSTAVAAFPNTFWIVKFYSGDTSFFDGASDTGFVWCVRGGSGAGTQ